MPAVRRLRNGVKHGREIDIVERLGGEAGILWLRKALGVSEKTDEKEPAETPADESKKPTHNDYYRLLTRIPVSRGQQQLYKALYDAGDAGLTKDELVEVMGRRDRRDLTGVLGALGRRINGTLGYGQARKPGIGMVLSWEKTTNGQWLWHLRPDMRAVLEKLNPPWLHEMTP